MGRKRNWTGMVQGKLTILGEAGRDTHGNVMWLCRCECGQEVEKSNNNLKSGVASCSTACGVSASNTARAKHGMWNSKENRAWLSMKQRCLNPNNTHYKSYGGRGISIHPAWVDSFETFYADVGKAPDIPRTSLDRIDVDGDYEPNNVRWTTPRVQSNNRRNNLKALYKGAETTLAEIARDAGIPYHQVFQRYQRGLRGDDLIVRHKVGRKPRVIRGV